MYAMIYISDQRVNNHYILPFLDSKEVSSVNACYQVHFLFHPHIW